MIIVTRAGLLLKAIASSVVEALIISIQITIILIVITKETIVSKLAIVVIMILVIAV